MPETTGPATTGEVVTQIGRAADETMAAAILSADLHPEIAETVRVRLLAAREMIRAEADRLTTLAREASQ